MSKIEKKIDGEEKRADLSRNATSEEPPCPARANSPVLDIIWVGPHEVYVMTSQALVRHIL
jgi:hypothetical protein